MLRVILNLCVAAVLVVVLLALMRARRARQHHDISAAEIHPDLAVGEELVQDVLDEERLRESKATHSEPDDR
jgi:hypothetical protein